ncbi:hypothetical protein HHI36_004799 [Cryptolaemus montrouzieri]|uniref:Endonuclease/exonuclease/phosphatase domain-containing protein n=1 Tax=Cryptolaemus montrouzieri TaxID=559131 RepID=A0ABD2NT27_9CUCU
MSKKPIINNFLEQNDIHCAMFVEAKIKEEQDIRYRDWSILKKIGNVIQNTRAGSLVKCHPGLNMGKANAPRINNPLNEVLHFTIPFRKDKLHIFLIYVHSTSIIEESVFTQAALYKYAIIIGDFNVDKRKKNQINNFLKNKMFTKIETPPTFIMDNNPDSTPHLILHTTNLAKNITKVDVLPDLGSDHLALLIEFDLEEEPKEDPKRVTLNFRKCRMDKVNEDMIKFIGQGGNQAINEDHISRLNNTLAENIRRNCPTTTQRFFPNELPVFIVSIIKNKRKMYREY